jgi:Ca2+-binding EF-hand superfamily protein
MKEEKLWSAFKYFDTTNSGYITSDSVIEALKSNNLPTNEAGLIEVFNKRDGQKINFEQFKRILLESKSIK